MPTKNVSTIQCPKCSQTLPGWSEHCQFCGTTITKGYVRPVDAYQYKIDNRPTWKEVGYIVVSVIITLQGAYQLLQSFKVIPDAFVSIGGGTYVGIMGAINAILGLGMLFHQIWAQFIVKLWCWLIIAVSVAGFFLALMMLGHARHPWPAILSYFWTLNLFGFTLYLINEEGDA